MTQYLCVLYRNKHYLIELGYVKKIGTIEAISCLGICKPWFLGVASVGTDIVTLVDVEKVVFPKHQGFSDFGNKVLMLADEDGKKLSFVCDEVIGTITQDELVMDVSENTNIYLSSICTHKDLGVLYLLNIYNVFHNVDLKSAFQGF